MQKHHHYFSSLISILISAKALIQMPFNFIVFGSQDQVNGSTIKKRATRKFKCALRVFCKCIYKESASILTLSLVISAHIYIQNASLAVSAQHPIPVKKYRTKPEEKKQKHRAAITHWRNWMSSEPPIRPIITRVNIKSARGTVIASAKTDSLPREAKQAPLPPPCLLIHRARSLSHIE